MKSEKLLRAFGEIDDKLIEEAANIEKSKVVNMRDIRFKGLAMAACFVLVVCFGIMKDWNRDGNQIAVNIIKREAPEGSPIYYNPETFRKEEWELQKVEEYYGKNYTKLNMSLGLEFKELITDIIINVEQDKVVKDNATIIYSNKKEQKLRISLMRVDDSGSVKYEFEDEEIKISKVNGIEVMISGELYNRNNKKYNKLIAEFKERENIIKVEVNNSTLKEFEEILIKIIK